MKKTLLATYERQSTLWKNASSFYTAQDWVKMECLFVDQSDTRNSKHFRLVDDEGNNVTDIYYPDYYEIRLTNKRRNNTRSLDFATREEANEMFKQIFNDKYLINWHRVK